MSAQHTTGPWQVGIGSDMNRDFLFVGSQHGLVCDVSSGEANAHLIAAAPDMYDALWALLTGPATQQALRKARLALEKAKGG